MQLDIYLYININIEVSITEWFDNKYVKKLKHERMMKKYKNVQDEVQMKQQPLMPERYCEKRAALLVIVKKPE